MVRFGDDASERRFSFGRPCGGWEVEGNVIAVLNPTQSYFTGRGINAANSVTNLPFPATNPMIAAPPVLPFPLSWPTVTQGP